MRANAACSILTSLLLCALPLASRAGGQGPGLPFLNQVDFLADPPIDRVLEEVTSPHAGAPPPRFVCVDAPQTECVTRRLTGLVPNEDFPVVSPDCPTGPNAQRCRPDYIAGAALTAQLYVGTDVETCSASQTPVLDGTLFAPATSYPAQDPPSPRFVGQLALGSGYYTDRSASTHYVGSFPDEFPELSCARWLKWRNGDKDATAANFLLFEVSPAYDDVVVWVAYDTKALSVPNWLSQNFTDTGVLLNFVNNGAPDSFRLWKSAPYTSESLVVLGGNKATGAVYPPGVGGSNYLVALTSESSPMRCRSYWIDLSLAGTTVQWAYDSFCYDYDPDNNEYFPDALPPLLDGIGYFAGSGELACDTQYLTPSSEDPNSPPIPGVVRVEQSVLGTTFGGGLDRGALIEIGQQQLPGLLCLPNAQGVCTYTPAVALIEPNGVLTRPTRVDPNWGALCNVPVRFAKPASRPAVVLGSPANDVDTSTGVVMRLDASGRGSVADVDVSFALSFPYADNLRAELRKDGISVPLDGGRPSNCDTQTSTTNVTFDDEATAPPPASCGTLSGRLRPAQALSAFDGIAVEGTWELRLRDVRAPGDFTDLLSWSLDITTSACSDGYDNDGDGKADNDGAGLGPADPNCPTAARNGEGCGLGAELVAVLAALSALRRRSRGGPGG